MNILLLFLKLKTDNYAYYFEKKKLSFRKINFNFR